MSLLSEASFLLVTYSGANNGEFSRQRSRTHRSFINLPSAKDVGTADISEVRGPDADRMWYLYEMPSGKSNDLCLPASPFLERLS